MTVLLVVHAAWLAWGATWQSPTLNEPGHLASGLAHWTLGRFEPYAVNPPMVRMVAALPVLAAGYESDWSGIRGRPGERPEFLLGEAFIKANGGRSQQLMVLARWASIPFSLLGGWMCFVWGRAMFGDLAGLLACGLWCVEPNILAHGQLITPDVAATSLGLVAMWTCWRWLTRPTWPTALAAGAGLGLAIMAKFSWLLLIGLWPAIWLSARWRRPESSERPRLRNEVLQLAVMILVAVYVINSIYGFDGTFSRLDSFQFASRRLSGESEPGVLGNRFAGSWIGALPVPFPRPFVTGLDLQKKDFEWFPHESYLAGEWKQGGWWHYYLYAAAVKVPIGLWLLGGTAVVVFSGCLGRRKQEAIGDADDVRHPRHSRLGGSLAGASKIEPVSSHPAGQAPPAASLSAQRENRRWGAVMLLVPAMVLFVVVSSQTTFNHHFRYVLPAFGPAFVLISGVAAGAGRRMTCWILTCWTAVAVSSALAAPHGLSYFNVLAGGMHHGGAHLLHSNIDWGQDLVALEEWIEDHPEATPIYLAYYGFFDPLAYGVNAEISPQGPFWETRPKDWSFRPGWYAISVNYLHQTAWRLQNRHAYAPLLREKPVAWCGGSIAVYRVDQELAGKLTEAVIAGNQ